MSQNLSRGRRHALHFDCIAEKTEGRAVSIHQLLDEGAEENHFLLTFDDGGVSCITLLADLLEQHNWVGHFFITTDYIGKPGFLDEEQIRELDDRGHVIGSHSCSHPLRITDCSYEELLREWGDSCEILGTILGKKVDVASVPGGFFNQQVAQSAIRSGIRLLFSSEPVKRAYQMEECLVLGRYAIAQGVSAETAAGLAATRTTPVQIRQYLFWNTKKLLKRVAGNAYRTFRARLLRN